MSFERSPATNLTSPERLSGKDTKKSGVCPPNSDGQVALVQVIRSALAEQQIRNPNLSLRSFSKQMNVAPAEISLILSGKRRISQKMALKLLNRLAINPASAQALLERLPAKLERRKRTSQTPVSASTLPRLKAEPSKEALKYIQLSTDEFNVIADWYYLALLSLAETETFKSDPEWISKRLGIRLHEARNAVETLLRLNLLKEERRGKKSVLKATGQKFATTNEIPSASIRKNHAQSLELARQALQEVPVELREFGASIIAADLNLLPAAKTRLRELRREIAQILESGAKKEVYRLSVQLIPLTRPV